MKARAAESSFCVSGREAGEAAVEALSIDLYAELSGVLEASRDNRKRAAAANPALRKKVRMRYRMTSLLAVQIKPSSGKI
jgi:hypothetical protein